MDAAKIAVLGFIKVRQMYQVKRVGQAGWVEPFKMQGCSHN